MKLGKAGVLSTRGVDVGAPRFFSHLQDTGPCGRRMTTVPFFFSLDLPNRMLPRTGIWTRRRIWYVRTLSSWRVYRSDVGRFEVERGGGEGQLSATNLDVGIPGRRLWALADRLA